MCSGSPSSLGRRLDGRDQLEVVLEPLDGRHEHVEPTVARLDRDRRAHRPADIAEGLLDALLRRLPPSAAAKDATACARARGFSTSGSGSRGAVGSSSTTTGTRRAEHEAARRAAGDSRPDCRRARERACRGASSISRCASAARSPAPASAGSAARSRKARSARARRRARCAGAPPGPSASSSRA